MKLRISLSFALLISLACLAMQFPFPGGHSPNSGGIPTWAPARAGAFSVGSGLTVTTTISGGAPAQHHTMIAGLILAGSTPTGLVCHDGAANSYTKSTNSPGLNTSQGLHTYVFYLLDSGVTATAAITCTWTGAVGFSELFVDDFVDSGGTQVFDKDAITADPVSCVATSAATPSLTPAVVGELLYNLTAAANLLTAPTTGGTLSGWTGANLDGSNGPGAEYILSQGSAKAAAWTCGTSGDGYAGVTVAFKP